MRSCRRNCPRSAEIGKIRPPGPSGRELQTRALVAKQAPCPAPAPCLFATANEFSCGERHPRPAERPRALCPRRHSSGGQVCLSNR